VRKKIRKIIQWSINTKQSVNHPVFQEGEASNVGSSCYSTQRERTNICNKI